MPNDMGKQLGQSFLMLGLNAAATQQALENMRHAMDEALFGNVLRVPAGVSAQMFEAQGPPKAKPAAVPLKPVTVKVEQVEQVTTMTTPGQTRRTDLEDET